MVFAFASFASHCQEVAMSHDFLQENDIISMEGKQFNNNSYTASNNKHLYFVAYEIES